MKRNGLIAAVLLGGVAVVSCAGGPPALHSGPPASAPATTASVKGLAAQGVFVDAEKREISMKGKIVFRRNDIIEYFVCAKGTAEHESIIAADANPLAVRLALMLPPFRLAPGKPAKWDDEGKAIAPTGPAVLVYVEYEDPKTKKLTRVRAEEWVQMLVKDPKTQEFSRKPMAKSGFIFTGGAFIKDPDTGESFFLANDNGSIITTYWRVLSVIDNPQKEAESDEIWFPNLDAVPPLGTPVTVILKPAAAAAASLPILR